MKLKNILIVAGLFVAGSFILVKKKVDELQATFDKMTMSLYLARNVRIGLKEIKFDLDIILKNNSNLDFFVSGSAVATLTRLQILYQNNIIGVAHVNISEIALPAYDSIVLKDIPIIISTSNFVNNLSNINNLIKNFEIIGFVNVLGIEYQVG